MDFFLDGLLPALVCFEGEGVETGSMLMDFTVLTWLEESLPDL